MRTAARPRSTSTSRASGKVLKKVALSLLGALVLFETVPRFVAIPGLDDAALRPAYLASEEARAFGPHPYLIFTPKPGFERKPPANNPGGKQFRHAEGGFRAPGVPLEKPEGTLRIACIGGSSTYGTGPSHDDATWAARLGAELNVDDTRPRVDVLNAGVPSWTSFECLTNFAFRVVPYAPDVVLIYLSTNDAESALWPDPTTDNAHYRVAWPTFRPSPLEGLLERSITYLAWRRYATDYLEQRADLGYVGKTVPEGRVGEQLKKYVLVPPEGGVPEVGFANFQRNLVSIVALARAHGATPVLLTQAIWSPDPESDDLNHGRTRLAAHARMTEIVRAVASERDVPLVEMKEDLESAARDQIEANGEQTLFVNNVHLTDDGAARFAARLAAELRRIGVL